VQACSKDGELALHCAFISVTTPSPLRRAITAAWMCDEAAHVRRLLDTIRQPCPDWADADRASIHATATDLVRRVRARNAAV